MHTNASFERLDDSAKVRRVSISLYVGFVLT
jgi:hypothetical protein